MSIEGGLSALYYPFARPNNIENMRNAILVFDHIYFVRPVDYSRRSEDNVINAPSMPMNDEFHRREMQQLSSDDQIYDLFENDIFKTIDPLKTDREFMKQALKEDQQDETFKKESSRPSWDWVIATEKSLNSLVEPPVVPPEYKDFEDFRVPNTNSIRVPFDIGESIMISHAVYACYSKQKEGESISPITDGELHRKLLVRRLNRGIENVKSKQHQYEIPKINNAIDISIPKPTVSVQKIIDIRRTYEKPLNKIRAGIKILANIMQNPDDLEYESKIVELKGEILTAYNELGLTNTPKDIVKLRRDVSDHYVPYRPEVIGADGSAAFGVGGMGLGVIPHIAHGMILEHETLLSRDVFSEISHLPKTSSDLQLAL